MEGLHDPDTREKGADADTVAVNRHRCVDVPSCSLATRVHTKSASAPGTCPFRSSSNSIAYPIVADEPQRIPRARVFWMESREETQQNCYCSAYARVQHAAGDLRTPRCTEKAVKLLLQVITKSHEK